MINNQNIVGLEITDFEIEELDDIEALDNEAFWWLGLGVGVVVGIAAC